jgi:hypothetical protein
MPRRSRYGREVGDGDTRLAQRYTTRCHLRPYDVLFTFPGSQTCRTSTPTFPSHGVLENRNRLRCGSSFVLFCKDGKILFDKPSIESWSSLLPTRRHLLQEDGSFTYAPIRADKPTTMTKDKKESLPDTMCFVEYVDCLESDTTMIAMVPEKVNKQHTHTLRDPVVHYPVISTVDTFRNTTVRRNLFSCDQACASLYATSFNSRCDSAHLLHCGQRPLVSTRYAKYFGVDTHIRRQRYRGYFHGLQPGRFHHHESELGQRGLFNSTHPPLSKTRTTTKKTGSLSTFPIRSTDP